LSKRKEQVDEPKQSNCKQTNEKPKSFISDERMKKRAIRVKRKAQVKVPSQRCSMRFYFRYSDLCNHKFSCNK